MKTVKGTFHRCLQDSQELGSDNEHMVSRVWFTLKINDREFEDLHADLKQTVGSDFESGYIEVGPPQGYDGPFNHEAFRDAATKYYLGLVGSGGEGIRVVPGAHHTRMQHNEFTFEMKFEFEIS